ncbi:MAG: YwbE family protein [Chloroflexales bacterium]|nr:YwbE family protein [Chloroflexales bacterium]
MDGQYRKDIRPGLRVAIVRKQDQRTGRRTLGVVKDILTSAPHHTRGIKVRLEGGQIGWIQAIEPQDAPLPALGRPGEGGADAA